MALDRIPGKISSKRGDTALQTGQTVQIVHVTDTAVATGSAVIPDDDTIPQNTEGTEFMTLSITPSNTNNILQIDALVHISHSATTPQNLVCALFQDSTADALGVGCQTETNENDKPHQIHVRHRMTAGTTSATTFKIRAGHGVTVNTYTFNGESGARRYGGVFNSYITIKEIVV